MFKTAKNTEYKLSVESKNKYIIALKDTTQSSLKWLSFTSAECFLLQGAILGSWKYSDVTYNCEETNKPNIFSFKIISKYQTKLFSSRNKEIISVQLISEKDDLSNFIKFINHLGMELNET